jgi:formamidopyrimidine-DNA glycosylase
MTTNAKLIEAENAMHALVTGQRVASITRDGKSVVFQQSNKAELALYIQSLKGSRRAISVAL